MLPNAGRILIWYSDLGADPDHLFYLKDLGYAGPKELGIPSGLVHRLHLHGIITRRRDAPTKSGWGWVPGPIYSFWYDHYKNRRETYRIEHNMPLDVDPRIITRMIIRAGCDPDDFLNLTARSAQDFRDRKVQAQALISMGLLMYDPGIRCFVPGKNFHAWVRSYPEHRDDIRLVYRLPKRQIPYIEGPDQTVTA